ncbi:MAG: hypothetical protein CSA66_06875, partial [Proteobacteria bacterium]
MKLTRYTVHVSLAALALIACSEDSTSGSGGDTASDTFATDDTGGLADSGATDAIVPEDAPTADTVAPGDATTADTGGGPQDTSEPGEGEFLWPCQGNRDCLDGFCVEGAEGFFCTKTCIEECPEGMDCKSVLTGSADPVFLCLPRLDKLCVPCRTDYQCTGGACLDIDGGGWCASTCEGQAECPEGYTCAPDPAGVRDGGFCQPASGSCECTPALAGAVRTCFEDNAIGTCFGVETCAPEVGWVECSASPPQVDICDGLDNDCDGLVDDGIADGGACSNEVAGVGSCDGVEVCLGAQGLVCNAPTPQAEVCDFKDNDCDGVADEDFKDAGGGWTLTEHCGTCGNDCTDKFPHGTGRCDTSGEGTPICVVDTCDDDYVALNQFQCTLPPDVSCQPCAEDGDCLGGTCVELDGQRVCVSPCGGETQACGEGFACEDLGDGVERCLPLTRSCVCSALTDGQTRTCTQANDHGVCFGQQVCDLATGWSACTATTPGEEICDGVDNDCNGLVDDGITPPGDACEAGVAGVGTCVGTWFCTDPSGGGEIGWWCSAPEPTVEVCDFVDNDCDGVVDDGFKDPTSGLYLADAHCGSCGVSCAGAIPHATAACAEVDGIARCQVLECDEGFYPAGPLTCIAVTDDLCTPCQVDAHCPTPGDRCLSLDGGGYCGRDCGADNPHGAEGECPAGFACVAQAGGGFQCEPTSGACSCLLDDQGASRTCVRSNDLGTCYGQETCDPATGWGGCTATAPAAEVCDGVDNDCNGAIDDVPGRGAACTISNEHGQCDGLLDCADGGPELTCVGRVPAPEACNYIDDDCNGVTDDPWDDALFQTCSDGQGVCRRFGFTSCADDGAGVACSARSGQPGVEICDGFDNDCDGAVDEAEDGPWGDKGAPCTDGVGACEVTGVKICSGDGATLVCSVTAPQGADSDPCNGVDDDCNGVVDDAFADDKGDLCTAGQGQCLGYGNLVCAQDGAGLVCNAVEGDATPEVCDLLDNDCDGVTDNGFQVGGRYVGDTACGNCFTDCTAVFHGYPGGYGRCDSGPATPQCRLSCCRAGSAHLDCDGGDYYNLNEIPDDGCELQLDPAAIYVSEADGDDAGACGLGPHDTAAGAWPCKTIARGIARAAATGGRDKVLVAAGAYDETVTVVDGVSLYGGYSAITWERDPAVHLSAVFGGGGGAGHRKTLVAEGITDHPTVVDGFTIYGQVASGVGQNSYAVYIRGCDGDFALTNNLVRGGVGGPGAWGTRGGDGQAGGDGGDGDGAYEPAGVFVCHEQCSGSNGGGSAGHNDDCSSADGGAGGASVCPDFNEGIDMCTTTSTSFSQTNANSGASGQGGGAGAGGVGGCDSMIDPFALDQTCDCKPASSSAACPNGATSAPGGNGADGGVGAAGAGCTAATGRVVDGEWLGYDGGPGGAGGNGAGGGGGGAGGGVEQYNQFDSSANVWLCDSGGSDFGGSGGGGGAGGCGAGGGTAGGPGGGAF